MGIKRVSVRDIELGPNVRAEVKDVSSLMESIKKDGLLQPVVVAKKPGSKNKYLLVAGYRRLKAIKNLKRATIPANVIAVKDGNDFIVKNSVENLQRENISAWEQGKHFNALKEKGAMSDAEIAAAVSVPKSFVKNCIAVFRDTPKKWRNQIVHKTARGQEGISVAKAKAISDATQSHGLTAKQKDRLWEETIKCDLKGKQIDLLANKVKNAKGRKVSGEEIDDLCSIRLDVLMKRSEIVRIEKKLGLKIRDIMRMKLLGNIDDPIKFV